MSTTNGAAKPLPSYLTVDDEGVIRDGLGLAVDERGQLLARPTEHPRLEPPARPREGIRDIGPLDRLPLLTRIAIVGGARIREAAAKPIVWLWCLYVVAGQIVVLYGAPGSGKTTLLFLLIVARASCVSVDVLGRTVEPAPEGMWIVILEGEHEEGSASRKLVQSVEILFGRDLPTADPLDRIILLARKEVRLETDKWSEVRALFNRGLVSDLFVDSLARLANTDSNSEQEQVAVFAELGAAIESSPGEVKPTVWMVAHGRKSADGSIDDLSGSAQRAAQADTMLFVRATRDDNDKVISSRVTAPKLREEGEQHPSAVDFSIAKNDAGRWHCTIGGASARREDTPAHERVYAVLETAKTKNEIREALKINGERLEKALSVLFAEKRIRKTKKLVMGRQRDAFVTKGQSTFDFPSANRRPLRSRSDVIKQRAGMAINGEGES